MATLWRVDGLEQDGDLNLSVLSASAVETGQSFHVETGALRLSTVVIPKRLRLTWRIGLTRDEAIELARGRVERECDSLSDNLALQHRKLTALIDLKLEGHDS